MILTQHRMYVRKHSDKKRIRKTFILFLAIASLLFSAQVSFAVNGRTFQSDLQSAPECEAEKTLSLRTFDSVAEDDTQADPDKPGNGKTIQNMTIEELTVYLRRMKFEDPEMYSTLIEEMDDDEYGYYYEQDQIYSEYRLFENAVTITPFTIKNEKIVSGTDILIRSENGRNVLPEFLLFHIVYADGYETYVYGSDGHISYTSESGCIRVKFLDDAEIGGMCVLTQELNMTAEGPEAEGYVIPVPGNMNVRELGRQLKENQRTEINGENAFGKEEKKNEEEKTADD